MPSQFSLSVTSKIIQKARYLLHATKIKYEAYRSEIVACLPACSLETRIHSGILSLPDSLRDNERRYMDHKQAHSVEAEEGRLFRVVTSGRSRRSMQRVD